MSGLSNDLSVEARPLVVGISSSRIRIWHVAASSIPNGYVVTVDPRRNVWPGGFVAIAGRDISAVGHASETPAARTSKR